MLTAERWRVGLSKQRLLIRALFFGALSTLLFCMDPTGQLRRSGPLDPPVQLRRWQGWRIKIDKIRSVIVLIFVGVASLAS